jgi:hypothetical protein
MAEMMTEHLLSPNPRRFYLNGKFESKDRESGLPPVKNLSLCAEEVPEADF